MPGALASALLFGRFASMQLRHSLSHALVPLTPAVLRARLRAVASVDASKALARIRVPVLFLQASEDRLVPASVVADFQRILPRLVVTVLEGPHALLQANPSAAAGAIMAFAEGVRHLPPD